MENSNQKNLLLEAKSRINYAFFMELLLPKSFLVRDHQYHDILLRLTQLKKQIAHDKNPQVFREIGFITEQLSKNYNQILHHRKNFIEIGQMMNSYDYRYGKHENKTSFSIPLKILMEIFEFIPWLPSDLPWNAAIGLGKNAGTWTIEERILFEDMGFFYQVTQLFIQKTPYTLSSSRNIESFNRNFFHTGFLFIEGFVNSVGYNYYLQHSSQLSKSQSLFLQGIDPRKPLNSENNLSLYQKMRRIPSIITHKDPLEILKQCEPFITFFSEIKPKRNAIVHKIFSEDINLYKFSAKEVKSQSLDHLNQFLEVAKNFWQICYPSRPLPEYLLRFNRSELLKLSMIRIKDTPEFSF